jgi:hypothetical protein
MEHLNIFLFFSSHRCTYTRVRFEKEETKRYGHRANLLLHSHTHGQRRVRVRRRRGDHEASISDSETPTASAPLSPCLSVCLSVLTGGFKRARAA